MRRMRQISRPATISWVSVAAQGQTRLGRGDGRHKYILVLIALLNKFFVGWNKNVIMLFNEIAHHFIIIVFNKYLYLKYVQ